MSDLIIKQLQQDFINHKADEEEWRRDQDIRWKHLDDNWSQLVDATRRSAECQQKNTEAIESLVASTSDIVQTYRDFQGVTRIGSSVQKFCLWLVKIGAVGVGAAGIIYSAISYFSPPSGPGA